MFMLFSEQAHGQPICSVQGTWCPRPTGTTLVTPVLVIVVPRGS